MKKNNNKITICEDDNTLREKLQYLKMVNNCVLNRRKELKIKMEEGYNCINIRVESH